jgi:hypothetical protein
MAALLDLPKYLLGEVMTRLSAIDLARCELVCREMAQPCPQVRYGPSCPLKRRWLC